MKITAGFNFYIMNIQRPVEYSEVQINNSFITEFWFIESLETMFLTGELSLYDKQGYFETINFTGKETIRLIVQQSLMNEDGKDSSYRKVIDFEIYDVGIEDIRVKNSLVTLYLVEKGAMDYYGSNYSRGYVNKRVSEIVTDVFSSQLKIASDKFYVEPTTDILEQFYIPFWKPILTLKHLRKKARRASDVHESGYLCFSSTGDGDKEQFVKKNFVSFASLIEKNFVDIDVNKYTFKGSDTNQMFINNIKEAACPHFMRKAVFKDGIAGKRYFGVDYNSDANIVELKTKYSEFFNRSKVAGTISLFDISIDNINDDIGLLAGNKEIVDASQNSNFRQLLESYNIKEIVLEGTLYRYAGQKIWLEENSDKDSGLYHKHNTGYWVIRDITHYFENGFYTQKMIITKDAYSSTDLTTVLKK